MLQAPALLVVVGLLAATVPAMQADPPGVPDAATRDLLRALREPREDALAHALDVAKVGVRHETQAIGLRLADSAPLVRHAAPSEALLALAARHGVAPAPEQMTQMLALDAQPEPLRDALTRHVDAFIALETATQASYAHADVDAVRALMEGVAAPGLTLETAGIDLAPALAAREAYLDTILPLRDALSASAAAATACAPLVIPLVVAIDLTVCDNTYTDDAALALDAGGNDTYLNNGGGAGYKPVDYPYENGCTVVWYGWDIFPTPRGGPSCPRARSSTSGTGTTSTATPSSRAAADSTAAPSSAWASSWTRAATTGTTPSRSASTAAETSARAFSSTPAGTTRTARRASGLTAGEGPGSVFSSTWRGTTRTTPKGQARTAAAPSQAWGS
ncbi:MAG TPA: hypothetical protein VHH36_00760 [Candidatus Thermoplasmatota archaeon]|nr:hypothetical protein [Candidatus Thermoplasmatota archaeon]